MDGEVFGAAAGVPGVPPVGAAAVDELPPGVRFPESALEALGCPLASPSFDVSSAASPSELQDVEARQARTDPSTKDERLKYECMFSVSNDSCGPRGAQPRFEPTSRNRGDDPMTEKRPGPLQNRVSISVTGPTWILLCQIHSENTARRDSGPNDDQLR